MQSLLWSESARLFASNLGVAAGTPWAHGPPQPRTRACGGAVGWTPGRQPDG
jgi:hypothetical protein